MFAHRFNSRRGQRGTSQRLRRGAATVASAAVIASLALVATPASAYEPATSVTNKTQVNYLSGMNVVMTETGDTALVNTMDSKDYPFGSLGYNAAAYSPAPANGSPALLTGWGDTPKCNQYGLCADVGTLSYEFNYPVRDVRMHVNEIGGLAQYYDNNGAVGQNSASTILHQTSTDTTASLISGTNLDVADGVIQAKDKNTTPDCATAEKPPGCGTVLFSGVTKKLSFTADQYSVHHSGPEKPHPGPDGFPVTFTFGQDYSDAPASYDAGNAARANLSDLQLSNAVTEDNKDTADAVASPYSPEAPDADDALSTINPASTTTPYSVTVPISGAGEAGQVCGWIDYNRNGTFVSDNTTLPRKPASRPARTFSPGAPR